MFYSTQLSFTELREVIIMLLSELLLLLYEIFSIDNIGTVDVIKHEIKKIVRNLQWKCLSYNKLI